MRIIPAHEKYRHWAGTRPWRVDLRSVRISQPPDYRTYSPEVTSLRSNLPVHRSVSRQEQPYHADLIIISDILSDVKAFFSVFHNFFEKSLGAAGITREWGHFPRQALFLRSSLRICSAQAGKMSRLIKAGTFHSSSLHFRFSMYSRFSSPARPR